MAFEPAIDITDALALEFSSGAYVSNGAAVYSAALDIADPTAEFTSGSYVSDQAKVFSAAIDLPLADVELCQGYAVDPNSLHKIWTDATIIYSAALASAPGDTGLLIVFGFLCDFDATPRVAATHQEIRFYDRTIGPEIVAWRWSFGDGQHSFLQNPAHSYTRQGSYSVTLEVFGPGDQRSSCTKSLYINIDRQGDLMSLHYQALRKLSPALFDGEFDSTLKADGAYLDRLFDDIAAAAVEYFPDTATADGLLAAWERLYGIVPDQAVLDVDRSKRVSAAVRASGGLSIAYFYALARSLGYKIGTHLEVGDSHMRITDDEHLPFRADQSLTDFDLIWDQGPGASQYTWHVYGTNVESDAALKPLFEALKPPYTEVLFTNE